MTGWVKVIGIGAGKDAQITGEVKAAIGEASDAIGYMPYIQRLGSEKHLVLHPSDNRVEIERARHAFELARSGKKVIIVSSGDPGVFAMASALFEVLEQEKKFRHVDVEILPGISAMFAASARLGAPLGHDFCAINLSDNLKPWALIEKRLRHAARGDFIMAFYNPRSQSRPEGFVKALEILREELPHNPLIIFARNVTSEDESFQIMPIFEARPEMADMRTLVIVGNSQTRQIEGTKWIYSPRRAD